MLPADKVLVTIGTSCSMSGVGSTETYQAKVRNAHEFIAYAAVDAGLVDASLGSAGETEFIWATGTSAGMSASIEEIERQCGAGLRAAHGIRRVAELTDLGDAAVTDIVASLPHDLARGGLRRLAGITHRDIRSSTLREMHGLFDDDSTLGPSLQAQLFVYSGLGVLAALPRPLADIVPHPFDFRVAAAAAFAGMDALRQWRPARTPADRPSDKFAMRLASALASHGPALIATMLAPRYPLGKSLRNPRLLETLRSSDGYMRVPQTPLTGAGACASSSIAFCDIAPQMILDYPGFRRPLLVVWTAADAATQPSWEILDAFGQGALVNESKLNAMNADRRVDDRRAVSDCLAPFDVDAAGTVVGDGGSAILVTTLDFALKHFIDITSIIVGWGQSGEAGGKTHFAGVGFGGGNAITQAFDMAWQGHGYGIQDFGYFVAHATGTRANSKTDLATVADARSCAAARQKWKGRLPQLFVGAPKAVGDGHSMGETGLKGVSQGLQYVLGKPAPGIPTLRVIDPEVERFTENMCLQSSFVPGDPNGGAFCATQGFGGYNGAIALRAASADALARYAVDRSVLDAYIERWPQLRREREQRERGFRLRRRSALELAEHHCWRGPD